MERPVGDADAIARFAQSLMQKEVDESGLSSRKELLSSMFDGNVQLLNGDASFEEMFLALEEEIMRRNSGIIMRSISDSIGHARGRRKFFW